MCTSGVNRQNEFVFYKQMLTSGNRCFSLFNKPLHLSHKRGRENRVRCAGGGSKVSKFLRYGKEPDEVCIMFLSSLALERNLLFAFHLENIRIIECYPILSPQQGLRFYPVSNLSLVLSSENHYKLILDSNLNLIACLHNWIQG